MQVSVVTEVNIHVTLDVMDPDESLMRAGSWFKSYRPDYLARRLVHSRTGSSGVAARVRWRGSWTVEGQRLSWCRPQGSMEEKGREGALVVGGGK